MKYLKCTMLFLVMLSPLVLSAQYYDQGAAPASVKWNQIRTRNNRVIFPAAYEDQAIRVMHYLDTVRLSVGYGYRVGTMKTPVVIQGYNLSSNGLVMRAPTRMELIVPPPAAATPEPWLKQLVTHESRHTVQFNLMDRNFVRWMGYLLGDQGKLIGQAFFPLWGMEGDAVIAETELSNFGRGLQPSFTIDYRAMVHDKREHYSIDKWFCGSYKDFMPDHYAIGYQVTTYANTVSGENVWDRVGNFASKYPYSLFTTKIAMWKYYHTSVNKLSRATLADLDRYWSSQPPRTNSSSIIPSPVTSFTEYGSPLLCTDGSMILTKTDLDRPNRIVWLDTATGKEKTLFYTGSMNTSPVPKADGKLYWTELRNSTLWTQKVNSQLCWGDLATGRKGVVRKVRRAMFPVVLYGTNMAYVQYEYDGSYTLRTPARKEPLWHFPLPVTIHGLAADAKTQSLCFIAVDDRGMYIGAWVDNGGEPYIRIVKQPSFCTINDLCSDNGRLWFTSTQSGRDEVHMLDITSGREWRISDSQYGSFDPTPVGRDSVAMLTYTSKGYLPALQKIDTTREVYYSLMPENVVNPPRSHWPKGPIPDPNAQVKGESYAQMGRNPADIPGYFDRLFDTVPRKLINMDSTIVSATTGLEVKRYRRIPHMLNFHSWAPVAFDPGGLVAEKSPNVNVGATVMSQDLLSTTILTMRYAYTNPYSQFEANLTYLGLAPKFNVDINYGGGKQILYLQPDSIASPKLKNYFDINTSVFLPLTLGAGYHIRVLQPLVSFEYYNGIIYKGSGQYENGVRKLRGELLYTDAVRMASRDFLPRWGYALSGSGVTDPCNSDFGILWTGYGRAYLPGVALHHSLMLRAAYQWQSDGLYHFKQKILWPTGADYDKISPQSYVAMAVDYQLPIAYPDGGITSIIYFKRVRLNVAANYARYRNFPSQGKWGAWHEVWSYGGDIIVDTNLLRTPAPGTNHFKLSIYHPTDRKGLFVGIDFSLPI